MADADDKKPVQPMNIYTAMLVLSFLAVSIGCLILAIELYGRGLPFDPKDADVPMQTPAKAAPAPVETPAEAEDSAEDATSETE